MREFVFKPKHLIMQAGKKPATVLHPNRAAYLAENKDPDQHCNTRLFAPKPHHIKRPVVEKLDLKPTDTTTRPAKYQKGNYHRQSKA